MSAHVVFAGVPLFERGGRLEGEIAVEIFEGLMAVIGVFVLLGLGVGDGAAGNEEG